MNITVSAPGKIHLLGEHAVVYGKPAILAAINRRVYIGIRDQGSGIRKKKDILIDSPYGDELVRHAINVFEKAFSVDKLPSLEIKITSEIPVGSGLGSSAAVCAATIGALLKFVKNLWNPVRINELTFEAEKIAHGNPSGADNTTVVFGGLVWFRREFDASTSLSMTSAEQFGPELTAEGLSRMPNPELLESERPRSRRPVERVDFLKSIRSLPVSSYKIPEFVLLDSGRPEESTKEMVEKVAFLYQRKKKLMEEVLSDQEVQTKRLLLSFRNSDKKGLLEAIRKGEENLEKMEVVGKVAEKIIRKIEMIGGVAKICGAGGKKKGSGMILAYNEKPSLLYDLAEKLKIPIYPVKLAGEGIKIEENKCMNA